MNISPIYLQILMCYEVGCPPPYSGIDRAEKKCSKCLVCVLPKVDQKDGFKCETVSFLFSDTITVFSVVVYISDSDS